MTDLAALREQIATMPFWDKRGVPGGKHVKRSSVLAYIDEAIAAGVRVAAPDAVARKPSDLTGYGAPVHPDDGYAYEGCGGPGCQQARALAAPPSDPAARPGADCSGNAIGECGCTCHRAAHPSDPAAPLREALASLAHTAHGDWYNGHRADDLAAADRALAALALSTPATSTDKQP